jgi:hypothetical protein
MPEPLAILRNVDLALLAVALPVFVLADWPIAGWAGAVFVWLAWRFIAQWSERKAQASGDIKKMASIMTASMIGRGWLLALTLLAIGLGISDQAGLAAGVLLLVTFTVSFTANLLLRPFDTPHQPTT